MLTRKVFNEVAKEFSKMSNGPEKTEMVETMARIFKRDNPRFNTERFIRACGIGQSELDFKK